MRYVLPRRYVTALTARQIIGKMIDEHMQLRFHAGLRVEYEIERSGDESLETYEATEEYLLVEKRLAALQQAKHVLEATSTIVRELTEDQR